ncbi:hypothetical protein [Andreprevotia lacus]|jgi:hypothetical protein|nr:hypothetical protein [Andreprevotia lacus]
MLEPLTADSQFERRAADRRVLPDSDDEFWHWANLLLNGNERRSSVGRRSEDYLH